MTNIAAFEKIVTRLRPQGRQCAPPQPETITSHAALCPICSRESRIGLDDCATVYASCQHLRSVEQQGDCITVTFGQKAA